MAAGLPTFVVGHNKYVDEEIQTYPLSNRSLSVSAAGQIHLFFVLHMAVGEPHVGEIPGIEKNILGRQDQLCNRNPLTWQRLPRYSSYLAVSTLSATMAKLIISSAFFIATRLGGA